MQVSGHKGLVISLKQKSRAGAGRNRQWLSREKVHEALMCRIHGTLRPVQLQLLPRVQASLRAAVTSTEP